MLLGERPMSEFGSRFALGRASYELHHDELEAFRHHINASSSSRCALAQPVPPAISSHSKAAAEYATWKVPLEIRNIDYLPGPLVKGREQLGTAVQQQCVCRQTIHQSLIALTILSPRCGAKGLRSSWIMMVRHCLLSSLYFDFEALCHTKLCCNVGTLTPIVKNPDAAFMSDQVSLYQKEHPCCMATIQQRAKLYAPLHDDLCS